MVKTKEVIETNKTYNSNGDGKINSSKNYSIMNLNTYDNVRHIEVNDAYSLVKNQKNINLPIEKLKYAVDNKQINIYEFKGKEYLDRLDIGRIYYQTSEKKEGLTINRYFNEQGKNPFESV